MIVSEEWYSWCQTRHTYLDLKGAMIIQIKDICFPSYRNVVQDILIVPDLAIHVIGLPMALI